MWNGLNARILDTFERSCPDFSFTQRNSARALLWSSDPSKSPARNAFRLPPPFRRLRCRPDWMWLFANVWRGSAEFLHIHAAGSLHS
jgi:hypothetical protein